MSEHVLMWQIYEHKVLEFLRASYEDHFEKLFRKRLTNFAMNELVAETLARMASVLGKNRCVTGSRCTN